MRLYILVFHFYLVPLHMEGKSLVLVLLPQEDMPRLNPSLRVSYHFQGTSKTETLFALLCLSSLKFIYAFSLCSGVIVYFV